MYKKKIPKFRNSGEKSNQKVKRTYLFQEEFFNVLKPHIPTSFQTEKHSLETSISKQQKNDKDKKPIISVKAKKVVYKDTFLTYLHTLSCCK